MGRIPRVDCEGEYYHIYNRRNDRVPLFLAVDDYFYFLIVLSNAKRQFGFRLHAYCLMPNHFHLMLQRCEVSLSTIMHRVQLAYAVYFNKRYGRSGHVFEGAYNAIPCRNTSYFKRLLKYIHQNPVRAGLSSTPGGWEWSGDRVLGEGFEIVGGLVDVEYPHSFFGSSCLSSREGYRHFMASGIDSDDLEDLRREMYNPISRGGGDSAEVERDLPLKKSTRPDLEKLCEIIAEEFGIPVILLKSPSRARCLTSARKNFIEKARGHGFAIKDIAAFLDRSSSAIVQLVAPGK